MTLFDQDLKRILITGHHGFVGRHFVWTLQHDGHELIGSDIRSPIAPHDCRDGFSSDYWQGIDLVIHSRPPSRQSRSAPPTGCRWPMTSRSTRSVPVGSPGQSPEGRLLQFERGLPGAPSGSSRPQPPGGGHRHRRPFGSGRHVRLDQAVGELQVRELRKLGHKVLVVRPFSGYGMDQSLNYPFPSFIDRAKRRVPIFDVWGDGEQSGTGSTSTTSSRLCSPWSDRTWRARSTSGRARPCR